ncbi:class I SAM-dependent methyltransferase [Facilibium subflavum]|uniref:class I SAM-dependent methyltransferase n=1 Tax=Facilibium subflavum TaxID=2219058 RepID=UPI000E652B38|nr:class I SAM-dependent methyltransferase [Facilibium subflavum]
MHNQAHLYKKVASGQYQAGLNLIKHLQLSKNALVLDIGAGTGQLTYTMAQEILPHGQVVAIEPDQERISLAQQNSPKHINNIHWVIDDFLSFAKTTELSFDVAYSNYVFHWIKQQQLAVDAVYRLLKPGAKFGFCCVTGMPEVIKDISFATKNGHAIVKSLNFSFAEAWLSYFKNAGFRILQHYEVPDYVFADLDEVMQWWQATTHARFQVINLEQKQLSALQQKYSGKIHIYQKETLCFIAQK